MVVTVKDFREGAEARRKKKLYTRRKLMHSQRGTDRRNLIFSLLLLSPPFLPRISFFFLIHYIISTSTYMCDSSNVLPFNLVLVYTKIANGIMSDVSENKINK